MVRKASFSVQLVRGDGAPPRKDELDSRIRAEGLEPRWWSNGPGDEYGWHAHEYHKVLYCATGSIVFHTRDGDVAMEAGDRLDLPPATEHAASVGLDGVTCVEAARYPDHRR